MYLGCEECGEVWAVFVNRDMIRVGQQLIESWFPKNEWAELNRIYAGLGPLLQKRDTRKKVSMALSNLGGVQRKKKRSHRVSQIELL